MGEYVDRALSLGDIKVWNVLGLWKPSLDQFRFAKCQVSALFFVLFCFVSSLALISIQSCERKAGHLQSRMPLRCPGVRSPAYSLETASGLGGRLPPVGVAGMWAGPGRGPSVGGDTSRLCPEVPVGTEMNRPLSP